jgi:hypothetical protein
MLIALGASIVTSLVLISVNLARIATAIEAANRRKDGR